MRISQCYRHFALAIALGFACTQALAQAQEDDQRRESPESDDTVRPEHRARPLPTDTFKPSEDISEDFAVPFPVDI